MRVPALTFACAALVWLALPDADAGSRAGAQRRAVAPHEGAAARHRAASPAALGAGWGDGLPATRTSTPAPRSQSRPARRNQGAVHSPRAALDRGRRSDRAADVEDDVIRERRLWPYFDGTSPTAGAVTAALRGVDPGAPRRLVLWRFDPLGAPREIARSDSDAGGRFDFGQQLLALDGSRFQVVPLGQGRLAADAPSASRILLRVE